MMMSMFFSSLVDGERDVETLRNQQIARRSDINYYHKGSRIILKLIKVYTRRLIHWKNSPIPLD